MKSKQEYRTQLQEDANQIIRHVLKHVQPDIAVARALKGKRFSGRIILIAAGKAAWQMTYAASKFLGDRINAGVVVTKYGHAKNPIPHVVCYEGGHPVPDENSFAGTQAAIDLVQGLQETDTVLFLLSGGGSALFEVPLISKRELQDITSRLLACGADIVEINTIRKRLSAVKGGRFAKLCYPAKVFSIVLSDILGDPLDMIASGPTWPDRSTCQQAKEIVKKYNLKISEIANKLLDQETPKNLENTEAVIAGSVKALCSCAVDACKRLGYETIFLTDQLNCQAKEAGAFLASIALSHADCGKKMSFIAGGETVVRITGGGLGGRNQELALSAATGIAGLDNVVIFSIGSDGTDGPTDAAGGLVDGGTAERLGKSGISVYETLLENDSYHALQQVGGLITTGPTGTNVNDLSVVLIGV